MSRKKPKPKSNAGRPPHLPAGTATRSIRCTDEEFRQVREFLDTIRGRKTPEKQANSASK